MRKETVNIIVIGYAQPKLERACLKAIHANTAHPYLLTYFDNYASGWSLTAAWNNLVACSPCETICLLNNDTEVYPDWLTLLYDTLWKFHEDFTGTKRLIGIVGPSTNQCHSPQKTISTFVEAKKHQGEIEVMPQPISGFCFLFAKSTWIRLDGFDKRYDLYGQESDFADRAMKRLDYFCGWRKDAFVFHHGEASVKAAKIDVEAERKKAKDIYWSERT